MDKDQGTTTPNYSDKSHFSTGSSQNTGEKGGIPDVVSDDPFCPVRGEIALWNAVITQALLDARINARNNEERHMKWKALHWLTAFGKDFCTVCDYANLTPEYIHDQVMKAIKRGFSWRAEPGTKATKIIPHKKKKIKPNSGE